MKNMPFQTDFSFKFFFCVPVCGCVRVNAVPTDASRGHQIPLGLE